MRFCLHAPRSPRACAFPASPRLSRGVDAVDAYQHSRADDVTGDEDDAGVREHPPLEATHNR